MATSVAWAAIDAATDRSPWSVAHRKAARRSANSRSTQSSAMRCSGPFHRSHAVAASAAKYDACRCRTSSVVPCRSSWSSPKWRIVSSRPYRVCPETGSAVISDLRTNESSRSSTAS